MAQLHNDIKEILISLQNVKNLLFDAKYVQAERKIQSIITKGIKILNDVNKESNEKLAEKSNDTNRLTE